MWLPPPQRREELQFYLLKDLAYGERLGLSLTLMALGLLLEALLMHFAFWIGLPLVLAGVLLLLTRGYENKPSLDHRKQDWRPSTKVEVDRIPQIQKQQKTWDADAIDITCARGCGVLVVVVLLVVGAAACTFLVSPTGAIMLVANAAVMLLPFWITGVRTILTMDQLIVKVDMLSKLSAAFEKDKKEGEEFQFQLQTAAVKKESGEVPRDIKAILLFHAGSPEFLGMQMQVSINNVQGTSYPYFYCVLVGRLDLGLEEGSLDAPPDGVILESKREQDVDIIVIRQHTTKTSGYHTKYKVALRIFQYALGQARGVVQVAA